VPPGRHPPAPGSSIVVAHAPICVHPGLARLSASLPPVAFLSPSRVPGFDRSHSLTFDSLRRVKSATSSGLDATPVSFRLSQSPLAAVLLRQAPPSIAVLRCRGCFIRSGSAALSPAFAGSCSVVLILADTRPLMEAITTLLSIVWPVSPDRVLGMHATPFPPGGKVPPGRQPILRQVPTVPLAVSGEPFA